MTRAELMALPVVVDLMTAARALQIGRTLAYELAQHGQFPCPVRRVGRTYHVPVAGLLELLGMTQLAEQAHTNGGTRRNNWAG
ncbi:MAG TPA: DNA-binding protein [Pseudonocardiaceae bacterium]|nr:DNA-binding protein [Pseudonocardiaceae bacterium]